MNVSITTDFARSPLAQSHGLIVVGTRTPHEVMTARSYCHKVSTQTLCHVYHNLLGQLQRVTTTLTKVNVGCRYVRIYTSST